MEGEKGLDGDGKDEQGQENDDFDLAAALDGWGEDEEGEGEDPKSAGVDDNVDQHAGHNSMQESHVHGAHGAGPSGVQDMGADEDHDHGMGALGAWLPRELLLRVLAFVSADDLLAAARTCRALRDVAGEEVLWRRLYCARWGKPRAQQGEASWKAQYIQRDAEEASAMDSGDGAQWPGPMQALYRDMRRARRQQALGRGQVDDTMEVPRSELQERLAAWRRTHGHPQPAPNTAATHQAAPPADTAAAAAREPDCGGPGTSSGLRHTPQQHTPLHQAQGLRQSQQLERLRHRLAPAGDAAAGCSTPPTTTPIQDSAAGSSSGRQQGANSTNRSAAQAVQAAGGHVLPVRPNLAGPRGRDAYTWDVIGPYYCCRETGWVHLCDHTCREGVVDPKSDCVVCPISCRTTDRLMMTEYELEQEAAARGGHEEGEPLFDFNGFVGRAYEAGYDCLDEGELARVCGVKLR